MLENNNVAERRRFPRAQISATAILLERFTSYRLYAVENLSAGGACLIGESKVTIDQDVTVCLVCDGQDTVCTPGRVLRVETAPGDRYQLGIQFKHSKEETITTIRDMVRTEINRNRSNPNPIIPR